MHTLSTFKDVFDTRLEKYLDSKLAQLKKQVDDKTINDLFSHTKKIVMNGGKRVRPYMAALSFEAYGGKLNESVWRVLLGIELFHAFALVHDDIMDLGTDRHGTPTIHEFAKQTFKKQKRIGDLQHISQSHGILIGDMLFVWANECIFNQSKLDRNILIALQQIYTEMNQEVMLGQMLDVDGMARATVDDSHVLLKTSMKTAGYTFVQPLRMGWALAGSPKKFASFAESFGRPLGIAFQIQDDLLDLIGTAEELGKQPFSDLRDGQHTLFSQYIFTNGTKKQKETLRSFMRSSIDKKNAESVFALFEESGAFEMITKKMNDYFKKAEKAIRLSGLSIEKQKGFIELYEKICSRIS
ncbi:MAG TPA: polyprenyl synthetase family protein [bacterium]|nr:polyprenyl synthetase family protein [Candidatus Magasanikbacteria bacterium]HPF95346.1 polyprenyl synthetase family protein [bacterium]